ncbi:M14 family metallopeptidase [Salisaeta longa]|uniref:M14 family metallopeptidase n=1 Tax=Salisaeta longa TaxID=503170 RepID=UPI0003B37C5C|nr:M14 family metallopeptidase [Salisaeta longa]
MRKAAFILTFFLCIGTGAKGQSLPLDLPTPTPGVEAYDASIPTPEEVIGHRIGTRHTRPAQVVDYFQAVAAASERVVLKRHGATHEGRPLIHAIVTNPANQQRLDEIKAANQRLSAEPGQVNDAALQAMPAVVMMGYSIHGDEASGTEAAILLLYHMAAGQGAGLSSTLENVVTIIDPMFNPDGRARFVNWVNQNRGATATTDPQDREHTQPWPGGRTNHYWFDLNRDWLLAQHPASKGRLQVFHDWRPQVLTDYHEMGPNATYFFQPGIPSRTNPNTPQRNQRITGDIATYHAQFLDRIGSLYYTRESFDDFYYGKGSTYPDINGAIGILFEQASSRALKRETRRGVLRYPFTIRNQLTASLSTLTAATEMRETLLQHQRSFYENVDEALSSFPVEAYVVARGEQRTRAEAMARVLHKHRVQMYELGRQITVDGQTYAPGEAYVVPLDQQQGRFVKAVMERTTTFPDSLFYDVSTWTFPLAFGVQSAALNDAPEDLRGEAWTPDRYTGGRLIGGRSDYAYVIPWGRYFAPRALYRLQKAGIKPRLMTDPFTATVNGRPRAFERGAIVVRVQQFTVPADTVHAVINRIPVHDHVNVYGVETGLTPTGPDLGSRGSLVLETPRIALITGTGGTSRYSGADAYNAGEVWHLLSERMHMPVSLLDMTHVASADLSRYNTMVLAGGSYGALPVDKVKRWVQDGGRLIALADGMEWPIAHGLVDLKQRELKLDSLLQDVSYANLSSAYGAQYLGGSIFSVDLDNTHPVAYGYDDSVPVFREGITFYDASNAPGTDVGVYDEDRALLSGYISDEVAEKLRGAAAIEAHDVGAGSVTLMAFNPNFRAFWYGTNGLFLNAIFFSQAY